jgi:hypothetical protein
MTMPDIKRDIKRMRAIRRRILSLVDTAARIVARYPQIDREPDWVEEIAAYVTRRRSGVRMGPCDTMDRTIETMIDRVLNSPNEEDR